MDLGKLFNQLNGGGGGPDPEMMANMGSMINNMVSSLNETMQPPPQSYRGPQMPLGQQPSRMPPPVLKLNISLSDAFYGKKKKIRFESRYLDGSLVSKKRNILIPAGIKDQDEITINGVGNEMHDGQFSDISAVIDIKEHDTYVRFGDHLIVSKEISLFESLFDCSIVVNTIDEKQIVIKKQSDIISNNTMRFIDGHGMPIRGTDQRGGLYVLFKVDSTFKKITTAQKESIRKLFTPKTEEYKMTSDNPAMLRSVHDIEMNIQPVCLHNDYDSDDSDDSDGDLSDGESIPGSASSLSNAST